jgi:putative intracellular protease/amidase
MNNTVIVVVSIMFAVAVFLVLLPKILNRMGLHAHYEGKDYDLTGKKALIITTSQGTLGDDGKATGVYASEMTVPYYEFLDANIAVDIASIKGGKIPIEPISLKYPIATADEKRYLKDDEFKYKVKNSIKIEDVDISEYDLVFMSGGWGAAYDLGQSEILGEKITQANAEGKIIGSVCHGALGFVKAKEIDGKPLMEGKKMTAVTDKQIKELGITKTPLHPETELRKLGANYKSNSAFKDLFATLTVVDGNIVTGQNQNSGSETTQAMMGLMEEKEK